MPRVTSVEPQKRNLKRFNIFLDGKFAFGADEDLVVNYRLLPGKEIKNEDLEKLLYEAEVGKLMERMYRLFNIRQRSEKEVRDYLKRLSFQRKTKEKEEISEVVRETLIEYLKKKGLINDEAFALAWIDARRRSKKKGIQALKMELFQKGIDREIIIKVLEENQVDEEALAIQALERKLPQFLKFNQLAFKKKVYEFLLRRGFSYDVARGLVEKLMKNGYNTSRKSK